MKPDTIYCNECGDAPVVERDGWLCCGCCGKKIRRIAKHNRTIETKPEEDQAQSTEER